MKLRKSALGMSLGIIWGLSLFLITIWATARGHGAILSNLGGYYVGYRVTYVGAFVGLVWAFVHGFIAGVLIAWLYDLFCKVFYRSEPT